MWCVPKLDAEYVKRLEDLLRLYARPLNPREPVVCLDERPVQLRDDARPSIPADRPGTVFKRDSEYVRKGTANVFCVTEPKAGRHMTTVTRNRKGPQFAKMARRIAAAYPRVKTIHLVMDNLNTHGKKSLTDYYGPKLGRKIWSRFTAHYTPKHGSWVNMAEIEISVFSRQCLGKERTGGFELLREKAGAWNRRANREKLKINWGFTVQKARKKMRYDSAQFSESRY